MSGAERSNGTAWFNNAKQGNGTAHLIRAGKGGAWAKRGFGRGARQRQIWAEHTAALRSKGGANQGASDLSQAKEKHNSETRNNAAATAEHGTAGAKRVNEQKRQAMAQRHHETHRKGEAGPSPESYGEAKASHGNTHPSVARQRHFLASNSNGHAKLIGACPSKGKGGNMKRYIWMVTADGTSEEDVVNGVACETGYTDEKLKEEVARTCKWFGSHEAQFRHGTAITNYKIEKVLVPEPKPAT